MPASIKDLNTNDFMNPYPIGQLADDTAFYAENLENLRKKLHAILLYSARKYQVPNIMKTKYCHFSKFPSYENLNVDEHTSIGSIDPIKGYKYLGMLFYPTDNINDIILRNWNKRIGNISKFYAWLEINNNTPIELKLLVLDNCMFSLILWYRNLGEYILHRKEAN